LGSIINVGLLIFKVIFIIINKRNEAVSKAPFSERSEESPTYKLLILNSMGSFDSLPDRQAGSGKGGFKAFEIPSFPGKMINPILMLFQI
jgi:hypothetical protein